MKHQLIDQNQQNEILGFTTSTELLGFILPFAQNEFDDKREFIASVCQQLSLNTGVNFSLSFFNPNSSDF